MPLLDIRLCGCIYIHIFDLDSLNTCHNKEPDGFTAIADVLENSFLFSRIGRLSHGNYRRIYFLVKIDSKETERKRERKREKEGEKEREKEREREGERKREREKERERKRKREDG